VSALPDLKGEIERRCVDGRLPCVAAFATADAVGVPVREVVDHVNREDIRFCQCQLGLFGYDAFGDKRFVAPLSQVPDRLATALRHARIDGTLPCAAAWRIASDEGLPRSVVGSAAETLEIRIAPCQLGCF